MMQQPLISIIIPSHRSGLTIRKALESAAVLDIRHEIIVVDAMSDDNTKEVIKQSGISLAAFISEPDEGVYDAINKGIDQSSGEWIYILGSDDEISSPHVFNHLLLDAPSDAKLLLGDIRNIHRTHAAVPEYFSSHLDRRILFKNSVHQQGAVYHRSLFNERKFNATYKILGDYDFHLYLYHMKVKTHYKPIQIATCDARGLSKQFTRALYREEYQIKGLLPLPYRWFVWLKYAYKSIRSSQ